MDDQQFPASSSSERIMTRRGFATVAAAAGVAVASQARAAEVTETDVTIKTKDGVCDAAFYHPAGKGKWPGVVIFTDILGLRPAFRDMGRRMAAEGYAVVVPNPFYRTRKAPVLSGPFDFGSPTDRAKLVELTSPLNRATATTDAGAYLAWLDKQPRVNRRRKIGVQGYCMGGPFVFVAAALAPGRVGAAGTFHGGGLVTDKPDSPHLLIPQMKASLAICIAANDDQRQPDAKDKLRAAFDAAHVNASVEVFAGAQHGWCVKDGPVYDPAKAERAWAELLSLYGRALA